MLSVAVGGVIGAIAAWGIWAQGWPGRFQPEEIDLLTSPETRAKYVVERFQEIEKKKEVFGTEDKSRVLILGDSYAQDLVNMIHENDLLSGAEVRVCYMSVRCQIYRGAEDVMLFIDKKNEKLCVDAISHFYEGLPDSIAQTDMLIFAANWKKWAAERFLETLRNLEIPPQTRVVVLGRKNFGGIQRRRYLGLSREDRIALRNEVSANYMFVNAEMKQNLAASGVEFIDLHAIVCGEASSTCLVFTPEGELISYDGSHLTQAGAAYLGRLLKEHFSLAIRSRQDVQSASE
jgi:hypothetical protein